MASPSKTRLTGTAFSALILSVLISNSGRAEFAVTNLFPATQSTNVCPDTPLRLAFNEPVVIGGSGKIAAYRSIDNELADVLDLSRAGFTNNVGGKTLRFDPIHIAGNLVSIQLHSHALGPGQSYYIKIDGGVFHDASSNELANGVMWSFSTRAALPSTQNHLNVAADGRGDFCTPQGALDSVPDNNQTPVEIYVRKGLYEGLIYIGVEKHHIRLVGEDRNRTIIAGRNNDRFNPGSKARSLVSVDADDFVLENMTLHNTTPYHGSQAEALRVSGDRCVLRNDNFYSFQDTLQLSGRVYVTNCHVEGDVDFIWGQGGVFFDRCEIKAVHNGYYLQSRNPAERRGYVFFQCKLTAAPAVTKCVLARIESDRFPASQAVFIRCEMGPHVPAAGWEIKGTNTSHLSFREFQSTNETGNSVDISGRHPASRQLSESEAAEWSDPAKVLSYINPWNPVGAQFSTRNAQNP